VKLTSSSLPSKRHHVDDLRGKATALAHPCASNGSLWQGGAPLVVQRMTHVIRPIGFLDVSGVRAQQEFATMTTTPVSLELDSNTLDRLAERERTTGETQSQLAQRYIEEGLRMAIGYYVEFRAEIDDWVAQNNALADRLEAAWRAERHLPQR
jgi:hypothetical protein